MIISVNQYKRTNTTILRGPILAKIVYEISKLQRLVNCTGNTLKTTVVYRALVDQA